MKESGSEKTIFDKMTAVRQLFPYMAFVYALKVPLWADQLLPQLLMKQFETLSIQCMKEFIIFVCTDSTEIFFSKLISAGCQVFSLTLTVGGGGI